VILPDNLSPLPVAPRADEAELACEDFVIPGEVRRLLLGGVSPAEADRSSVDLDSFAGRGDVFLAERPARMELEAFSDREFEGRGVHPAFERMSPTRRAAPPRVPVDREEGFGRSGIGDRWWVIGMGLAAVAVLFSGTAVDFISREAVRRSQAGPLPVRQAVPPAPGAAAQVEKEASESLAATLQADDRP
jgi:hypothetical protein